MISMNTIVVPVDFSEYSKKALRYAVEFARNFNAEIILIYVVEPLVYPADFSFGQVAIPAMESELQERGMRELQTLMTTEIPDLRSRAIVKVGKPFLEIIQTARTENADLIIIATHGHTGLEHALFGSTAEKVVRKAPCPVLTVREKEKEFIQP